MRLIELHRWDGSISGIVKVDDENYAWLSRYAWHLSPTGYAVRTTPRVSGRNTSVPMHRQILEFKTRDGRIADHINGDRLDNQRTNLREVYSRANNAQNMRSSLGSTSKYRGVYWRKRRQKWAAQICINGRNKEIGCFEDELDAARAASRARQQYMPYTIEDEL